MRLETFVRAAREQGASDVHLEPALPAAYRVRGALRLAGEPVPGAALLAAARAVLGDDWDAFLARGSADLSVALDGLRCRVNVLRTSRGVGFAIRLLTSSSATLKALNLHPDLLRLVQPTHGLVLVCGPTGSGKSSTLAALLQEVNRAEARHVITLESPIEYVLVPKKSFIRQREVGRDSPSFEQALVDALREDPDVLMVGELREPQVMRLTLAAAETGHLVLATLHASTLAEGLHRLVGAFPAEAQQSVCAQLADVLVGGVAQRLVSRDSAAGQRVVVPECEVLFASTGVKALVRSGQFFKLQSALETGAGDGCFTFARYQEWLERKTDFAAPPPLEPVTDAAAPLALAEPTPAVSARPAPAPKARSKPSVTQDPDGALVLTGDGEDPSAVLAELERMK